MMFCTLFMYAQKSSDKKDLSEKFFDLKLQKYPIADLPENSLPVNDIRVLQFLSDSVRMGYTYAGKYAYVTIIRVTKPLTEFLQELVYRMYKDDFKKTGIKLLWVLKDFRLAQKASEKAGYGYTKFHCEAYISKEGVLYNKALEIDTVILRPVGPDLPDYTVLILKECSVSCQREHCLLRIQFLLNP